MRRIYRDMNIYATLTWQYRIRAGYMQTIARQRKNKKKPEALLDVALFSYFDS